MIGTHAPIAAPLEVAVLQEKWSAAEGPMPLGAQMSLGGWPDTNAIAEHYLDKPNSID
jgi:hypothetical protein